MAGLYNAISTILQVFGSVPVVSVSHTAIFAGNISFLEKAPGRRTSPGQWRSVPNTRQNQSVVNVAVIVRLRQINLQISSGSDSSERNCLGVKVPLHRKAERGEETLQQQKLEVKGLRLIVRVWDRDVMPHSGSNLLLLARTSEAHSEDHLRAAGILRIRTRLLHFTSSNLHRIDALRKRL